MATPLGASIRIAKIECDKYSTNLTAPDHGLPTGTRVKVRGIPEISESETFLTDDCRSNSFCLRRDICLEVVHIDTVKSIVSTKQPLQMPGSHDGGVTLRAFDSATNEEFCENYDIESIIDACSLCLQSYCHRTMKWIPAKLSSTLVQATLSRERCKLILSDTVRTVSGVASPVIQFYSEKTCMRKWESTLRAACVAGKLDKESQENTNVEPQVPDMSSLHVGSCGWKDCCGVFHRSAPLQFKLGSGLVSILYVEGLKSWCMLAEVAPLYPLEEEHLYLNLTDMEGPQLLYICRGSSLHGRWEPVLGPAPGPDVKIYKEVAIRLNGFDSMQSSLLLPSISFIILDLLFNYTFADWCGGLGFLRMRICGLSSLEAILCALRLWKSMQICSSVCRMWRDTLQPFRSLTTIFHHALQIPELSEEVKPALPSLPQAVQAIKASARYWNDGLMIPRSVHFKGKAWPAQISHVRILTEMSQGETCCLSGPSADLLNKHAQTFLQVAKKMLPLPLPWLTRPCSRGSSSRGDGRHFAYCDLLDFPHFLGGRGERSFGVLARASDVDGHMDIFSLDGAGVLPHRATRGSLAPLLLQGLTLQATTRTWSTTHMKPKGPTEPCGFILCKKDRRCNNCEKDVEGRTRLGASQLFGGYTLHFMDGPRKISFEIEMAIMPFFATSKDSSLVAELESLLPWFDEDNKDDGDMDDEEESDEDEGNEDEGDADEEGDAEEEEEEEEEEEAEEGEEGEDTAETEGEAQTEADAGAEAEVGEGLTISDGPRRRRLTRKQPPPPEWR